MKKDWKNVEKCFRIKAHDQPKPNTLPDDENENGNYLSISIR